MNRDELITFLVRVIRTPINQVNCDSLSPSVRESNRFTEI